MKNLDNKKIEFVHIGSVIDSLLAPYKKNTRTNAGKLARIEDVWSEVTGSAIAENTRPTALKDSLLLVNVTSSVWIQQLQYIKKDLIFRLNSTLGAEDIENIRFKIGNV